jgi:hypothetical protein
MAGATGRMAPEQSGVCRRDRRIDQDDAALWPMPARRAPRRAGSLGPLEDDDLHRRAAAGRSHRALHVRRPDQWRDVPRLGRAIPRSRAQARRYRHPRQSAEPQGRGRQNGDRKRRRSSLVLALLQPRSQPDRARLRQAESSAAQGGDANFRRPDPSLARALQTFTPHECANYLKNSGYRCQS